MVCGGKTGGRRVPREAGEGLAPQDGPGAEVQEQYLWGAEDRLQPWGRLAGPWSHSQLRVELRPEEVLLTCLSEPVPFSTSTAGLLGL